MEHTKFSAIYYSSGQEEGDTHIKSASSITISYVLNTTTLHQRNLAREWDSQLASSLLLPLPSNLYPRFSSAAAAVSSSSFKSGNTSGGDTDSGKSMFFFEEFQFKLKEYYEVCV